MTELLFEFFAIFNVLTVVYSLYYLRIGKRELNAVWYNNHEDIEYNQLSEYVRQNENTVLLSGSIFVTASLILLGQSVAAPAGTSTTVRDMLVIGSWAIYTVWLFLFQLLGSEVAKLAYNRLKGIEWQHDFRAHGHLETGRSRIRRWVWLLLLYVILDVGSWPLLPDLFWFVIAMLALQAIWLSISIHYTPRPPTS